MARKTFVAQRLSGSVSTVPALALVALLATALSLVSGSPFLAGKAYAADSVVTEIRIDNEGVKVTGEGKTTVIGSPEKGITIRHEGNEPIGINVDGEDVVRFGDDVIVNEGEVVRGDAVAILGSVLVNGTVEGDAVAVGGGVSVGPNGRVDGDGVAIGGGVTREEGGSVGGEVVSIGKGGNWRGRWQNGQFIRTHRGFPWRFFSGAGRLVGWIGWTIVVLILCLLVAAVAGRQVGTIYARARRDAFKMGLIGLAAWLLVGPVIVLFLVTIIGIPIGIVVIPILFALALLFGYTGVAQAVGERFGAGAGRSIYANVALGVLLLNALVILGSIFRLTGSVVGAFGWVITFVGAAVMFVAATVGLGTVIMTRFGTAKPKPAPCPPGMPGAPGMPGGGVPGGMPGMPGTPGGTPGGMQTPGASGPTGPGASQPW